MHQHTVLMSIPALRESDLSSMPRLSALANCGNVTPLAASFPCVTLPAQVNLTTGVGPEQHGVVANGFYWRDKAEVEMWTAWNDVVEAPQIWDRLHDHETSITSAVWFPLLCKGCGADYICVMAPIHNDDGSESLWCYTRPEELYPELRDAMGHFPLMNIWGPLANIKSTDWIVDSAVMAAGKFHPNFTYIYFPHLDNIAQKFGPDSEQLIHALGEVDAAIGRLVDGYEQAGMSDILWLAASEYVITPVDGASFPNRTLRQAGMLALNEEDGREYLVPGDSRAWALVDHQFAYVYVKDKADVPTVADLFRNDPHVSQVLIGAERKQVGLDHPRAGEIVLISNPDKWFAYYWWLDDEKAPSFARTVDIHRKPGYDPVELFIEMPAKTTPLDPSLVKGSHGYPADTPERTGILVSSDAAAVTANSLKDTDVAGIVLRNFGAEG